MMAERAAGPERLTWCSEDRTARDPAVAQHEHHRVAGLYPHVLARMHEAQAVGPVDLDDEEAAVAAPLGFADRGASQRALARYRDRLQLEPELVQAALEVAHLR